MLTSVGVLKKRIPKANIVVSPSDHIVTNPEEFRRVVTNCLKFTAETDAIVTLGMKPTRPETGYGYIQADLSTASARKQRNLPCRSVSLKSLIWLQLFNIRNKVISFGMLESLSGVHLQ